METVSLGLLHAGWLLV